MQTYIYSVNGADVLKRYSSVLPSKIIVGKVALPTTLVGDTLDHGVKMMMVKSIIASDVLIQTYLMYKHSYGDICKLRQMILDPHDKAQLAYMKYCKALNSLDTDTISKYSPALIDGDTDEMNPDEVVACLIDLKEHGLLSEMEVEVLRSYLPDTIEYSRLMDIIDNDCGTSFLKNVSELTDRELTKLAWAELERDTFTFTPEEDCEVILVS
jgi:hypothetical protein